MDSCYSKNTIIASASTFELYKSTNTALPILLPTGGTATKGCIPFSSPVPRQTPFSPH